MKKSWNIFSGDIKSISKNWVALIILVGLIFLPSLYAWLNIKASWDPYGQTDQIPVGVVNEDVGETVRDEDIDVGDELVSTLKDDDSMQWTFLERDDAMDQLEKGDLFAVIVIPDDFSKNLGTVVDAQPTKANVDYHVNEKINAIAPKITEKGASVIVDDISSTFVSTVNGIIFDIFNDIGLELEGEIPNIEQFEDYLFTIEDSLPDIHESLESTLADATDAQEVVQKAQDKLPEVDDVVTSGLSVIDETSQFLQEAEQQLEEMGPRIKEELNKAQKAIDSVESFIDNIEQSDIDFAEGEVIQAEVDAQIEASIESVENIEEILVLVAEQMDEIEDPDENEEKQRELVQTTLEELATIKEALEKGQSETERIVTFVDEKEKEVKEVLEHVKDVSVEVGATLDSFTEEYTNTIEPFVLEQFSQAKTKITEARGMVVDIQETLPQVKELLERTDGSLGDGKELLDDVLAEYPYVNDKITELANRVRSVQDEVDLQEVIDLLQNDPESERGFFAEPVTLTEHSLFPIPNYGTGMTPFYTVLSLWVGGLLLISLLATDVPYGDFHARELYFGKLFLFLLLGMLQTLIVTMGDIFLLQVDIANPVWFVIFGLFCSVIFITIIYTFVSAFGDVGKALTIVMLVLQISGSGGTYPVALLPKFFQMISPFLPFTYAVNIMREAVGGIVWSNALFDLLILSIFGIIAVVFAVFMKERLNKNAKVLMEKSREAGIFQ